MDKLFDNPFAMFRILAADHDPEGYPVVQMKILNLAIKKYDELAVRMFQREQAHLNLKSAVKRLTELSSHLDYVEESTHISEPEVTVVRRAIMKDVQRVLKELSDG